MAFDVSLKDKAQQYSGIALDVDKNRGKRGVPLGTPYLNNGKGLAISASPLPSSKSGFPNYILDMFDKGHGKFALWCLPVKPVLL